MHQSLDTHYDLIVDETQMSFRRWKIIEPSYTNVDGWRTDGFLFSIPVPSQIDFFSLTFTSPTHLPTYIFKLQVDSSPFTYSPINLKCVTLIPTHLFIYLPTFPLSYLPTL
jgi:hypothetical protein